MAIALAARADDEVEKRARWNELLKLVDALSWISRNAHNVDSGNFFARLQRRAPFPCPSMLAVKACRRRIFFLRLLDVEGLGDRGSRVADSCR